MDELHFGRKLKRIDRELLHPAWEGVHWSVLQPLHKSTSDAVCRDNARPVALWKWYRNMGLNASQCTWLQMGWAVVWKYPKKVIVNCCIGHGRTFSDVYCSEWWALYPQIRIRCCVQRQRSAQWALLQSSCGNDTETWDSMQISAPGYRCDELYFGKTQK